MYSFRFFEESVPAMPLKLDIILRAVLKLIRETQVRGRERGQAWLKERRKRRENLVYTQWKGT